MQEYLFSHVRFNGYFTLTWNKFIVKKLKVYFCVCTRTHFPWLVTFINDCDTTHYVLKEVGYFTLSFPVLFWCQLISETITIIKRHRNYYIYSYTTIFTTTISTAMKFEYNEIPDWDDSWAVDPRLGSQVLDVWTEGLRKPAPGAACTTMIPTHWSGNFSLNLNLIRPHGLSSSWQSIDKSIDPRSSRFPSSSSHLSLVHRSICPFKVGLPMSLGKSGSSRTNWNYMITVYHFNVRIVVYFLCYLSSIPMSK